MEAGDLFIPSFLFFSLFPSAGRVKNIFKINEEMTEISVHFP